jgi:EAL domain-containing protein (putative c-di-GMP-specific phosphodiesterase class I)
LLRWNHPRHGLLLPDAFIPLAEATGLIVPIGNWVLQEACRQHAAWRSAGMPRIGVAVNLSARQFHEAGLDGLVADALAAHGLAGGDLVLEITESLLMSDIEAAGETLMRLKRLGVHISLDDFGTGYSSLSYLKSLPLDTLKIDRSFVRDISTDPNDAAIASTIISMARTMHLEVIAEGVETSDHLAYLRANNCQRAQGILFSPPVSAADFEKLLIEKGV